MIDFPPYEDLKKIEPQNLVSIMEKVNQSFSDKSVPIPTRIESINLLRSLRKYQSSIFLELFGALKSKFLTLKEAPVSRIFFLKASASATVKPIYSATTTDSDSLKIPFNSASNSAFSSRFTYCLHTNYVPFTERYQNPHHTLRHNAEPNSVL